jgi:type III restriction enzyme
VAIDTQGHYWLIEVKADDAMRTVDVQAKRDAARVWARTISRDEKLNQRWHYVLASEIDVATVHGSWPALQRLAEQ